MLLGSYYKKIETSKTAVYTRENYGR